MNHPLHEKAVHLAQTYKTSESALLEVLMQMSAAQLFLSLGYKGIFDYCVRALALGEAQASYFNRVAEKSKTVPQLKEAIVSGHVSLSQGRRIVSVITPQNAEDWLKAASTLKQRELEARVAESYPKVKIKERIRPIAPSLKEMRVAQAPSHDGNARTATPAARR